ncbi:MAG: hypothetical protein QW701_03590 [Candidatus Nezhaarchaeales archaeon]
MLPLLITVLEAAFAIAVTSVILIAIYGLSLRATKSVAKGSEEKRKPFACGESLQPSKTGLPDLGMYSIVWKRVFHSLYSTLRDRIHTGILSDWMFWMFIFMVILIATFVAVMA